MKRKTTWRERERETVRISKPPFVVQKRRREEPNLPTNHTHRDRSTDTRKYTDLDSASELEL